MLLPLRGANSCVMLAATDEQKCEVQQILARLVYDDQRVRKSVQPGALSAENCAALREVEKRATCALKKIIAQYGWPTISQFGAEADLNAWLIAQHAESDIAFQKEVLAIIGELIKNGESDPANYAYLFDRIAIEENRNQRYGTQYCCDESGCTLYSCEGELEAVNALRKEVGLPSLTTI